MRHLFLYIFAFLCLTPAIGQNIPNGGFEDWSKHNLFTLDSFTAPLYNVYRTTDKFEGRYALRLENTVSETGTKRRSYAFNVISSIGQTGMHFEGDVLSLVFFAKYDLADGDTARIYVRFRDGGTTKGYVDFRMVGKSDGYVRHSVPIFWYGSRTPTEAQIYLYSNIFNTCEGNGYIQFDDLRFENLGRRPMDIFNHGFENWTNIGVDHPSQWRSLDLLVIDSYNYFLAQKAVVRSSDAHTGGSSLRVGNYMSNTPRSSYVYIGTENDDYYTPAFKLYRQYNYIEGYYKYITNGTDSGRLDMRTFRNGGQASRTIKNFSKQETWRYFNIPINYYNMDSVPDSAAIIAYSTVGTVADSGSYLLLDDINLVHLPTHSSLAGELPDFLSIYPQPARDELIIDTEREVNIHLMSVHGQEVISKAFNPGKHTVDVSFLSPGTYFLILENKEQQWKTKILKQ